MLKDKIVVITGGSSGIGKACAILFAKKGCKVVIGARRMDRLLEVRKEIEDFGGGCVCVKCDVTLEDDVKSLFLECERFFGGCDILVNCAGGGLKKEFLDISYEDWKSTIGVNYSSVFLCSKEACKSMIKRKVKGHVITVSSLAGLFNIPGYSGYCSSKHAVSSFKSSIKWELFKYGIKVSTIHPYKVDTAFFDGYEKRPGRCQMLSSMDVADYIVALASRNLFKIIYVRGLNLFKRFYYFVKYI